MGGGRPDRKVKKKCPASMDLESATSEEGELKPPPVPTRPTPRSEESSSKASGEVPSSREERKCQKCMKLMNVLRDKIFYLERFTTTRERARFSLSRKRFLDQMSVRDFCKDTTDEDCVSVVNFISKTHNTALCLGRLKSGVREDEGAFCGCVAEAGSPRSSPLVCSSE